MHKNSPEFYAPPLRPPRLGALLKQFRRPRYWGVWLLTGILRLLGLLPLPALGGIGAVGGELAYRLHRGRAFVTRRNLCACFPHLTAAEINALARAHFRMLVTAVCATGVGWWGGISRLDKITTFRRREIVDAARAAGTPIILLTPHFVGVEYGGIYLSRAMPVVSMHQPNKNSLLDELINRHRTRFGGVQFERRDIGRAMFRLIKQGHAFYYAPDQDPGRRNMENNKSVFAPFFGVPAATFTALSRIARLTGAAVIPCITRIKPYARGFEIIFGAPLDNYPSGDDAADAAQMNRAIEKMIEYAPAQYFWSHRRFKTRPPGAPRLYPRRRRE